MNEKEANIDLLFRNGLKDFEVLPPSEVCDSILSKIHSKSRTFIYLRAAAVVTILLTLGFFTYRFTHELSLAPKTTMTAFDVPAPSPVIYNPIDNVGYLQPDKTNPEKNSSSVYINTDNTTPIREENELIPSPFQAINILETKSLTITRNESVNKLYLNAPLTSDRTPGKIEYRDLQYYTMTDVAKPVKRWSITAMASPTYYSTINSGSDQLTSQLMSSEEPLFSYSGGVGFSYKISKRISIQSGLYYSSLGQKVDGISSFSGFQKYDYTKGGSNFEVLTTTGTVFSSNPDVYLAADGSNRISTPYTIDVFDPKKASLQYISNSLTQNFSYLELPVILRYKIIDKTIGINLIGGLSYNLLVNNSAYATKDGTKYLVGDTKGLNPLTLSSSLGMGMEYNLSGKLSLNLEPTFRYYLNPFSVTTGSFIHPFTFGIYSGVSYKF